MTRPRHMHQSFGLDRAENDRVREAWENPPAYGQEVFTVERGVAVNWRFLWFTMAGAKIMREGYIKKLNWRKGDRLFTDLKKAYTVALMEQITLNAKARIQMDESEVRIKQLIEELK